MKIGSFWEATRVLSENANVGVCRAFGVNAVSWFQVDGPEGSCAGARGMAQRAASATAAPTRPARSATRGLCWACAETRPACHQRATSVPRVEWQETRGLVVISWVTCLVILAFVLLALFPDLRAFDWEDHEATWIVPEERVHLSLLQGGRVLVKTAAV